MFVSHVMLYNMCPVVNIKYVILYNTQGCALAEPGGPWRLTFSLGRLENLRFFIPIIYWAPQILQFQSTGLPSIFLRAQPWTHVMLCYITCVTLCYIRCVMLCYIICVTLCYMTWVMFCYITCIMVCYITCVMLCYNIKYVMLYNICYVMLYDISYII